MEKYCVYCFIDGMGSPYYVGQTKNLKRRELQHKYCIKSKKSKYYNDLKYRKARKLIREGVPFTMIPLLENLSAEEANKKEEELIAFWRGRTTLYNLTDGGYGRRGYKASAETRKKISEAKKGTKRPHTEETKRLISERKKGKPLSDNHKKALKKAWETREPLSEVSHEKASKTSRGKINIKVVTVYAPDGTEYQTHKGVSDFCREHDLSCPLLLKVIDGKRHHHRGWTVVEKDPTNPRYTKEYTKRKSLTPRTRIKIYKVLSPDGKIYETSQGVSAFCREHGLTVTTLIKVLKGKASHHKGWRKP